MAAADDALALRCTFFGYPTVTLSRPVDWNHDPIRDLHWPICRPTASTTAPSTAT